MASLISYNHSGNTRALFASALDMQLITTHIDQISCWRMIFFIPLAGKVLITKPCCGEQG
jgi:hypothetical protein